MQAKNLEKLNNIVRTVEALPDDRDSIEQVDLIVAIEKEFGLTLHSGEYSRITSFNEIVLLLDEKGL